MAREGRPFVVARHDEDSEEALRAAYRVEQRADVRQRLQALWLLRSGERQMGDVAAVTRVNYRTVQRWVAWYRDGGLEVVRSHHVGGYGQRARLTPEQQERLAEEVATGRFHNAVEIRAWAAAMFGVAYTEGGMYSLLERLRCKPKVPRPLHEKANMAEQEAWKKGGLTAVLRAAGIMAERGVGWADEMRVGLLGTTRRVRGRRGVKVRQRLQLVREWRYLHLVVDPLAGRLWWFWSHTMQASVARSLVEATKTETDVAALVWDRAPSHRDETVREVGLPLIEQPPYAPELNPAERVFEHLRAGIEGRVYPSIEPKVAAVEAILIALDADPERVKRLSGWRWIAENLRQLRHEDAA